jgi:hypothetical protein
MSTQKKESTPVKGQAQNTPSNKDSNAQRTPVDANAQKGRGSDAQRKAEPEAANAKPGASERKPANERGNDSKRPPMNSKKH